MKKSAIIPFPIRRFKGVETKISGVDSDRGTLRRADSVNIVPVGGITFGPKWGEAWNQTGLGILIATALSGATSNKVHFVTVSNGLGTTFLVAWQLFVGRPRGMFHVVGTVDPAFDTFPTVTITATNNSVYRDKANLLPWYGSWIGDQLWLGNGTDVNLTWASAALALLGPASPPGDAQNPSQVRFPPCLSFVKFPTGQVAGAGNVTNPLRIWFSEVPSISYPTPTGVKTSDYSYLDLTVNASRITALSIVGESLVAHLDIGPPVVLVGLNNSPGGWKCDQRPLEANAGAINPNCARDTKISPFYLGRDLELYSVKQRVAYNKTEWRDKDIITDQSSGDWNSAATKPISGLDYFLAYDEKNGRTWPWMMMSAGSRQGLYCYDEFAKSVTGPWRYPDFLSMCQLRDSNLNGCLVCGLTRDGVFMWSDLAVIWDSTLEAYSTGIGTDYSPYSSAPTSDAGVPYIGVDPVNFAFTQVLSGQTLYMADPWSEWSASGSVTPTQFFKNARLSVVDLNEMDFGEPDVLKEMMTLRTIWQRNSRAYLGIFAQVNGASYSQWLGTLYPLDNWLGNLRGLGPKLKLRLIIISFNPLNNIMLNSVTPEYIEAVET